MPAGAAGPPHGVGVGVSLGRTSVGGPFSSRCPFEGVVLGADPGDPIFAREVSLYAVLVFRRGQGRGQPAGGLLIFGLRVLGVEGSPRGVLRALFAPASVVPQRGLGGGPPRTTSVPGSPRQRQPRPWWHQRTTLRHAPVPPRRTSRRSPQRSPGRPPIRDVRESW